MWYNMRMKKREKKIKAVVMTALAMVAWTVAAAGTPKAAPVVAPKAVQPVAASRLAGIIEIAPYADTSVKVTAFGMLIGNPIVPALMLASLQQSAVSTYGSFRTDAPLYLASYQIAPGRSEEVMVYPSVDRIARMALNNPGSERQGKDVLHLIPTDRSPHERYVVFSGDGQFAAFASSVELARQAIADCRPLSKGTRPLARVTLQRAGIQTVCEAGRKAGVTNLLAVVRGFRSLSLTLDLTDRGLALAFEGRMSAPIAGLKERLEGALRESFGGLGAGDAKQLPTIAVAVGKGDVVSGEVCLSKEQLRSMGKDFNSFVAAQMSGALSEGDGKGQKGPKGKKSLKAKERRK